MNCNPSCSPARAVAAAISLLLLGIGSDSLIYTADVNELPSISK